MPGSEVKVPGRNTPPPPVKEALKGEEVEYGFQTAMEPINRSPIPFKASKALWYGDQNATVAKTVAKVTDTEIDIRERRFLSKILGSIKSLDNQVIFRLRTL